MLTRIILTAEKWIRCLPTLYREVWLNPGTILSTLHDIEMEKRTTLSASNWWLRPQSTSFITEKNEPRKWNRTSDLRHAIRPALAPRAIYDTEGGRRVNNTTLFSSVVLLRPHTPGSGLCRSVFSRPVCPYAMVTFDPVTRDVTILPGAVPAGAARPVHSLGGGG